jgi:hypothetical protein
MKDMARRGATGQRSARREHIAVPGERLVTLCGSAAHVSSAHGHARQTAADGNPDAPAARCARAARRYVRAERWRVAARRRIAASLGRGGAGGVEPPTGRAPTRVVDWHAAVRAAAAEKLHAYLARAAHRKSAQLLVAGARRAPRHFRRGERDLGTRLVRTSRRRFSLGRSPVVLRRRPCCLGNVGRYSEKRPSFDDGGPSFAGRRPSSLGR